MKRVKVRPLKKVVQSHRRYYRAFSLLAVLVLVPTMALATATRIRNSPPAFSLKSHRLVKASPPVGALFELDGDSAVNHGADDWDTILNGGPSDPHLKLAVGPVHDENF